MKFIHLGDVHLGVKPDSSYPWSEERKQDIWDGFVHIINICKEEEVDLLLIAGDLFHKQPLVRDLKEVNYTFSTLKKTKVVIIAGNHDYISSRSNYIGFRWHSNVTMLINEDMDSVYFQDINTEVYGFSYYKREIKEPLLDGVRIKDRNRINILLGHGGDSNHVPFDLKTLESKGFDYIALGHVHKPEKLGQRIAYAGSIEPTDKTDIGKRGYIIGVISKEDDQEESSIIFNFRDHSVWEYINIDIEVDDNMTNIELQEVIRENLVNYDEKNIFIINLKGYRDPDIKFNGDILKDFGNVIEVNDKTIANYDFEDLYVQNKDNIIGSFILSIYESDANDAIKTKALYYGVEALIYGKEG